MDSVYIVFMAEDLYKMADTEAGKNIRSIIKYLKIDKSLNNKKAVKNSSLWFEDRGVKIKKNQIKRAPRIGVSYAGPVWSRKLHRFILK